MGLRNRMHNCQNPYQEDYKKVLCVCSAGLLRSPTAAVVLSQAPYNFNTRAVGLDEEHALIPIDEVLIWWADEIVCMDERQAVKLREITNTKIITLNVGDTYSYRDPELMEKIRERYDEESKKA